MKWIDSLDIALSLLEAHPDVDPSQVRFTDLYDWIVALEEFDDDLDHCNERILEAIQLCWINEYD
ncbi:Fe-S cluster assembly protein IscX [Shewanella psychrotolerans]|uniref:Fe-S cluster assembly protein IscX n=1 Tax=Shewanella psychrotolerans TaxID=2864206 RepID=UPI001C65C5B8|nr:Fe-S cluster assembly protein IscX [Shewanella psychrotolerans]QYK03255.1 Fe-S cluster assembly protein IscX [Shewanella psychrotolerans]